jgi:diguanylate cyclase (GGDEF)-like protein
MKDQNQTRSAAPRFGSPPWVYMTVVGVAGAAVLAVAALALPSQEPAVRSPMFWLVATMILSGEIWRIVTPGKSGGESPAASRTIAVAALLFWGFPIAVLLRTAAFVVVGLAQRPQRSAFKTAFNAAQLSLSLGAAAATLMLFGINPSAVSHPWVPSSRDIAYVLIAGLAYFMVNFGLVTGAIALTSRTPLKVVIAAKVRYQAVTHLVLFATAPLVAVAMATKSPLLVALFAFPLGAIYFSAAMSVQREQQANHDDLTGLVNRKMLAKQSSEALAGAAASGSKAGFLLIDLDRSTGLKQVNDTLGHAVGDRLLQVVAHRLAHSVRPGDVVARLGGDEFAVLLPSVKEATAAREVASRLRAALSEPVRLETMTFHVEASVGIAIYPDDANGFDQLMQRADVAMYVAKERRSGIERYTADADRNSADKLALASDLRGAVHRGEIELHYQPKLRLTDGKVIGMEALARWAHPTRGILAAAEFVGLAEQSHLMSELTEQVMDKALAQTAIWWAGGQPVQVCVNLPARDLLGVRLPDMISQALQRHGLPPDALRLDIDEQVLAGKAAGAAAGVRQLVDLGVGVSLDDFGTGYSSLAQLTRLGITEVKLDPDLVRGLPDCPERSLTVKSLVRLAQALGIRSIGEGVETDATAVALRSIGCDGAQGWYFTKPMNAATATEWLAEHFSRGYIPAGRGTGTRLADGPAGRPGEVESVPGSQLAGAAPGA